MNRKLTGLVGAVLLLVLASAPLATEAVRSGTDYIVNVTSGTSDKAVAFQGAFLLRGKDAPIRIATETTPFEFKSDGQALSALFKSKQTGAQIRVALQARQNGKAVRTS